MDSFDRMCAALTVRHGGSHAELTDRTPLHRTTPSCRHTEWVPALASVYDSDRRDAAERLLPPDRPPTAEEIEFHAALCERVARLRRERPGFLSALRYWVRSVRVH
jgi:hypothetical protein